jgi:hypothetical protein
MTVKKVAVMRNDRFEETGKTRMQVPLVTLTIGAKGKALIDLVGQGCLLFGLISESKCKG